MSLPLFLSESQAALFITLDNVDTCAAISDFAVYLLIKSFTSVEMVSSCLSFNLFISLMIAFNIEGCEDSISKNSAGVTSKYSQM